MSNDGATAAGCAAIIGFVVGIWAFVTWIGVLLWNWICAETFGWPALTFWKMAGLILLIGIVFGGIRHARSRGD